MVLDLNQDEGLGGGADTLAIDVAFWNKHLMEDAAYESVFQLKLVCHMSEVEWVVTMMAAMTERDTSYYSPGFHKHCFIS